MRIRIAAVATVVVIGLWVPSLAHALCGQIYTDGGYNDSYGFVWGQVDTWFESSNEYYLNPGVSCGEAMYYLGGSAEYTAEVLVQGPLMSAPDYHAWTSWWASAYAQLWINQGGFGEYWINGWGEEYLCLNGEGCIYSSLLTGDVPVSVPYPDIQLYASDYTPDLNSGPVQVWAQLHPYWASPEPIIWDGCQPDAYNEICWFYPSEVGAHTVSAWYPGGGFDSILIDVQQPPPPPPPDLHLFLDAYPFTFSAASPHTEADNYTPGSQYSPGASSHGESVPLDAMLMGQEQAQVELIAAYVNSQGQIVPRPGGVTGVTFSLDLAETSAFQGVALNYLFGTWDDPATDDTAPDFEFLVSACSSPCNTATASFQGDQTARVRLRVKDYGGFTTVVATPAGVQTPPVTLPIPRDNNDNWIPDAGWRYALVGTAPQNSVCADPDPQQNPLPWIPDDASPWADEDGPTGEGPPARGLVGDGLTRWEEYRGFVVRGVHKRMDPRCKDLFVASVVTNVFQPGQSGYMDPVSAVSYVIPNLRKHDIRVHHIYGEDDPPELPREYAFDQEPARHRLINWNFMNNSGAQPAINLQRAVRLVNGTLPTSPRRVFGNTQSDCPANPQNPNEKWGFVPERTFVITVDAQNHQAEGQTQGQVVINNEIRRTIAHEIGHSINVKHRNDPDGNPCDDGAPTGGGNSVMSSGWANGPAIGHANANFNADDRKQFRLHLNP